MEKERGLTEKPIGLALIVCDQVITEAETQKKSLIGTFSRIVVTALPASHPSFFIYLSLYNGQGKQPAALTITHEESDACIFRQDFEIRFGSPLDVLELSFGLLNLGFASEGVYVVDFQCNDERILERKIVLEKKTQ